MDVAVIGGGLTGLSAAYSLCKRGVKVTVFEKESSCGGLAQSFLIPGWEWPLEVFYHHFFTNDADLLTLARELNLADHILIKRPVTSTLIPVRTGHRIFQLDSPVSLLKFDKISPPDRLRTGAMLAFCKLNPFWKPLERITAERFIRSCGGTQGWNVLWEPLPHGKFGPYAPGVCASWFWARIRKRTTNLGYLKGGFQTLTDRLEEQIKSYGGKIRTGTPVESMLPEGRHPSIRYKILDSCYDKVLLTVPTAFADNLLSQLTTHLPADSSTVASAKVEVPKRGTKEGNSIPHLHAQMLILETKEPILKDVYWLNINDRSFPFLAAVAHTNFMDKRHYGEHHITYFGNYLPDNHPYLKLNKEQLLSVFLPYIHRLTTHNSQLTTYNSYLFTGYNAQPVHTLNYSRIAPRLITGIPNIYLANMDSVYPWDRGTNYAVKSGKNAAHTLLAR